MSQYPDARGEKCDNQHGNNESEASHDTAEGHDAYPENEGCVNSRFPFDAQPAEQPGCQHGAYPSCQPDSHKTLGVWEARNVAGKQQSHAVEAGYPQQQQLDEIEAEDSPFSDDYGTRATTRRLSPGPGKTGSRAAATGTKRSNMRASDDLMCPAPMA